MHMLTILFAWSLLLPKLLSLPSSHHDLVACLVTGFSGKNILILEVVTSEKIKQTKAVLQCNIDENTF